METSGLQLTVAGRDSCREWNYIYGVGALEVWHRNGTSLNASLNQPAYNARYNASFNASLNARYNELVKSGVITRLTC